MTPFNQLLRVRDEIVNIYKKYERFITPVLKFILTISVFLLMRNNIGYAKSLTKISVIILMGLIGVFLPPQLIMLLFILVTSLHVAAGSLEAGIIVFALLVIIYLLFIRLYPVESLFIVGTIIAFKFNVPYIIPLIAGLFSSLAAMVALVLGIIFWYTAPQFIMMMEGQSAELADIVEVINTKIMTLQEVFKEDQTLLASIIVLSVVLLTVYIIRKQNIDYAEYIAIFVGTIINLIGFLLAIILFDVDIGIIGLLLSTLGCAIIVTIAQFFSKVADYSRAETVQFEDDKNYYYVKVIPKIAVRKPRRQVQQNYTQEDTSGINHER